MSFFKLPVKEIILNDDSQVVVKEDDFTAYADNDIVAATDTGGFVLDGFVQEILWVTATAAGTTGSYLNLLATAVRMVRTAASAGVAESHSYVLTDLTAPIDGVFRIVEDSLDLTSTEYQNRPIEKRYQFFVDVATVDAGGAAIATAINGDKNATVTAAYTAGTDTLVLTAKKVGTTFRVYSADYTFPTPTITAGALPINTYDYLKNINWAQNVDFDRNLNWFPLPGVSYNSYYFEVVTQKGIGVGNDPHNELHANSRYGVKLWVKSGTTADTALNLVAGDVNA